MKQHELVSVQAQRLHSDEMERRRKRRGECKLGRKRGSVAREREYVCVQRERELRQRHVGDVVWLPQAEEGGGVGGERWKSAESESESVRERETKAGGEEARSKAWLKTEEKKKTDALVLDSERAEEKTQEESKLKTSVQSLIWNKSRLIER